MLMNRRGIAFLLFAISASGVRAMDPDYGVEFSTYLGGNRWDHSRDIITDSQDNIIIVGGTAGNFPVTAGAYDTQYNDGVTKGPYAGQHSGCDAFVAKYTPSGTLLWCTYLGGPNYDRAYAVEVDIQDNIILSGRAGPDFPTTAGAFQEQYKGVFSGNKGFYGYQNAFASKISADGTALMWSSYVGEGELCRGIDVDSNDDVFVTISTNPTFTQADPGWFGTAFTGSYQPTPNGGEDIGLVKIKADGSQVLWATWIGGTGDELSNANIRVDRWDYPYVTFGTNSTDAPTTPGAYDQTFNGGPNDLFVVKLSKDGKDLLYGTYLGGDGNDYFETHPTALDRD